MKFAKLSLAAIMAMSVSAFADVQNIKVSGDAKLYYSTDDTGSNDIFNQDGSMGQAAFDLSASADLANGVAGKIGVTALSTLGLEKNLVSATWASNDDANLLKTQWWVNEAWIAKTLGKTTIKVGRQELDTPLAFTEKWNIAANTFDAAVVLNQDIPKTTLVAAWVGRGNGASNGGVTTGAADGDDSFNTYGSAVLGGVTQQATDLGVTLAGTTATAGGAYAIGAVTTAIPMTTAQGWYYNVVNIATAYWLQADVAPIKGLTVGVQYANINPDSKVKINNNEVSDSSAWAAKVGYTMGALSVSAAYSSTDKDGVVYIANTATGTYKAQSKLYTEAWWTYGYVGAPDTDAVALAAEYSLKDVADLGAYFTSTSNDSTNVDMNEFTLTASKKLGALDTTLAYIYTDADNLNNADSFNTVQVYLTYNF
ncbi:porin [Hydrogenimonas thermophila]|uniref:Porin n=1 Tax=Hydrogenimonas thermophila TaxID=223786 RepID=A0A1I5P9S7_9BACT|nr:porin [Hydrogenimonas thermophila]SFP30842.1 porin [Hydrogenimonas thermophila]